MRTAPLPNSASQPALHRSAPRRGTFRRASWIGVAVLLLAVFALFQLLGWRDDTAILSGTSTSPNVGVAVIRGVLYALSYFLAVVISPILVVAAMINAVICRFLNR
jgi:hypothetical protein